jgi:hypothetical protein
MEITLETVFTQSEELSADLVASVGLRRKVVRLAGFATVSAALYGASMGAYHSTLQALISAVKVPLLFLLTLAVCLPSLHFLGLLLGSPVRFRQTLVGC